MGHGALSASTWESGVRSLIATFLGRLYGTGRRPPDKQKKATETVIQQAELLGKEWAP
jgi:hypothetical protein